MPSWPQNFGSTACYISTSLVQISDFVSVTIWAKCTAERHRPVESRDKDQETQGAQGVGFRSILGYILRGNWNCLECRGICRVGDPSPNHQKPDRRRFSSQSLTVPQHQGRYGRRDRAALITARQGKTWQEREPLEPRPGDPMRQGRSALAGERDAGQLQTLEAGDYQGVDEHAFTERRVLLARVGHPRVVWVVLVSLPRRSRVSEVTKIH